MPASEGHKNRPRSLSESLHIFTSGFPVASSPSPTRVGKVSGYRLSTHFILF